MTRPPLRPEPPGREPQPAPARRRGARVPRRRVLGALGIAGGALLSGPGAWAQPSGGSGPCVPLAGKRVRWIVPHAVGGGHDADSRLIEPFLERRLGAEVVVENVPGAGGIVGATLLRDARPNGLTMGLVNGPGLLLAALTGDSAAPDPATDFAILGRIGRTQHVWATGSASPLRSVDLLLREAEKRAILVGSVDVGGTSFASVALIAPLLGIAVEFVAGFPSSRSAALAAMRGDVDVVSFSLDVLQPMLDSGDLTPLLQISARPLSSTRVLDGVPVLGGAAGLAIRRARSLKRDVAETGADTATVIALIGAGRLIVAPRGLDAGLFRCLAQELRGVLTDPGFEAAARASKRALDVADADGARAEIELAARRGEKFVPILRDTIRRMRR